jgi:DNA ligase-1
MAGAKLSGQVLFSSVVDSYERLALLRSKKGKETELVKFFMREDLSLEVKVRLATGRLSEENLKVGPGMVERAISLATGTSINEVRRLLIDYGEYGEVVFLLKQPKEAVLTVAEVYETVRLLPRLSRIIERDFTISSLFKACTPQEARYVVRLILGDLKLGFYEGTVVRAVSRAFSVPLELVESAAAVLGLTEGLLLAPEGESKLSEVRVRPGQFLKPQLANLYEPDKVAYPVRAEYKYDGSRLQIHKWGSQVWLFSRGAVEKSETLPEVAELAKQFKAQNCIVDSEVVAVDEEGRFLPFQRLIERTGPTELKAGARPYQKTRTDVTVRAFDILFLNGNELMALPLLQRRKFLLEVVPIEYLAEGRDCGNEVELMRFYVEALKAGVEGIVVKSLASPYALSERTYSWLKLKPERDTIDCTIVKALHGRGKRAGFYSSFLMAVRDPTEKKLYTIGRVSNLSDDDMEAVSETVEKTKMRSDDEGVFVRATVVLEVTYQEIQETDESTSGYSLRVPKLVRFRPDKTVDEIDDLNKLKKLYDLQYERYPVQAI